jgi:flagellar basal body-associated protein FliL
MIRVILIVAAVVIVLVVVVVFSVFRDIFKSHAAYEERHGKKD